MMESDDWPLDAATATALVARVVGEIDQSTERHRELLLDDLLSAAWGTVCAQNQ